MREKYHIMAALTEFHWILSCVVRLCLFVFISIYFWISIWWNGVYHVNNVVDNRTPKILLIWSSTVICNFQARWSRWKGVLSYAPEVLKRVFQSYWTSFSMDFFELFWVFDFYFYTFINYYHLTLSMLNSFENGQQRKSSWTLFSTEYLEYYRILVTRI